VPSIFIHPTDAEKEGLTDGDWVKIQTAYGEVTAKLAVQGSMKQGHLRVPHGWWYPELRGKVALAGAFLSSDAVLCSDDDEFLDHEQGIPHFKGYPGRIVKTQKPADFESSLFAADA